MIDRAGRVAGLVAMLWLALPAPVWAGSSQTALSVGTVVPARCAVRTPGSLAPSDLLAVGAGDGVAMRCTKGTLPTGKGAAPSAAGPRITRAMLPASPPVPHAATSAAAATEAGGRRMVITVNF